MDLISGGSHSSVCCSVTTKRVAVMQPYFFPYAGYYRLFEVVDEFVIFDCVQFPRRGRVHRTEVGGSAGAVDWLNLPLARQPRDVLIRDLVFSPDARARFDERLARLPWIRAATGPAANDVRAFLFAPMDTVINYLEAGLRLIVEMLGLKVSITRSSALDLDRSLRGQSRVLAAAKSVGATHYVNAPGGQNLYAAETFARAAIELSFLPPYRGRFFHFLPAVMNCEVDQIRADIRANCH